MQQTLGYKNMKVGTYYLYTYYSTTTKNVFRSTPKKIKLRFKIQKLWRSSGSRNKIQAIVAYAKDKNFLNINELWLLNLTLIQACNACPLRVGSCLLGCRWIIYYYYIINNRILCRKGLWIWTVITSFQPESVSKCG